MRVACVRVQVAERALFLWNNEYIVSLIAKSRDVILPVLYPALEANTTKHWNRCFAAFTRPDIGRRLVVLASV